MIRLSDYLLTAEAAKMLGVSQNTLRAWAGSGVIPVRRNPANGYRLFARAELERFLDRIGNPTVPKKRKKKPAQRAQRSNQGSRTIPR